MIFILFICLLFIFNSATLASQNEFIKDYMSIKKTTAVKGIFVLLVFFSHSSQYISLSGIYDNPYISLQDYIGQMVVSVFWLYSGYGIMESIKKKEVPYVKSILSKRFPMLLINFDLCILLYILLCIFYHRPLTLSNTLLAFTGWTSVGNSNWYIFVTLILYILVFFSFIPLTIMKNKYSFYICNIFLSLLSILFILVMIRTGMPTRFYNTTILFSLGSWYSMLHTRIEKLLMKHDISYFFFLILLLGVHLLSYNKLNHSGIEIYTIWAVTFTLLVTVSTMKISFCNNFLLTLGNHIFSIYILQRIPMTILSHYGLSVSHKYVFLILCLIITLFMAIVFDYFTEKMWKQISTS